MNNRVFPHIFFPTARRADGVTCRPRTPATVLLGLILVLAFAGCASFHETQYFKVVSVPDSNKDEKKDFNKDFNKRHYH